MKFSKIDRVNRTPKLVKCAKIHIPG